MLNYITYQQTAFAQNCRVVFDAQTKNCIVCDPGSSGDVPYLYKQIENLGLNPQAIILTHGHHDHCGGAQELARLLNVSIIGPNIADRVWLDHFKEQSIMFGLPEAPVPEISRFLNDNEELNLNLGEPVHTLLCPGHTPGHICYYMPKSKLLLSGDVLFAGSIGRSDFPQGDPDALIKAIKEKIVVLPDDTKVLSGHGSETTIGREKISNHFLIPDIY